MSGLAHHYPEIARGLPVALLRDRPAGELFLPALRPVAIIDDQTDDGRAGGAPYRFGARGCDRHAPAHRQGRVRSFVAGSVRFLLLLTQPRNLAGAFNGSGPFGQFDGIGAAATVPVANLIHRHQGRFQRFAKGQPCHLSASVRYVPEPKDGAIGIDQNPIGASQNVNDC